MWKITWGDQSWTENDLRIAHLAAIVAVQGVDEWGQCDPLAGPVRLLGVLSVLIAFDDTRPVTEVVAELSREPAAKLLDAITVVSPDDASALAEA